MTAWPEEVAYNICKLVHNRIVQEGSRVYSAEGFRKPTGDISFNVPRQKEAIILEAIHEVDPDAVVSFMDVASLRGGIYEEKI